MKISTLADNILEIWFGDGNNPPQGWVISDGKIHNGVQTKDYRGLFLKGAGSPITLTDTLKTDTVKLPNNQVNLASDNGHSHEINVIGGLTATGEGAHNHSWVSNSTGFTNLGMWHWSTSKGLANSNNYNVGRMLYNTTGSNFSDVSMDVRVENSTSNASHSHTLALTTGSGFTDFRVHNHNMLQGDVTSEPKHVSFHVLTFVGF